MATQVKYADKTVATNGVKIHYLEWGDTEAPAIIALHGLRGHGHSWDYFAEPISSEYRVLAWDARGRGESDWVPDGDYGAEAYVKDLEGFCEALKLDSFVLMGHSMGGRTGMLFTPRHPSMVKQMVIVDSGAVGDPRGQERIKREVLAAKEEYDSFEKLFQLEIKDSQFISPEIMRNRLTYQTRELPNGKIGWRYDIEIRQQFREDRRPPMKEVWSVIPNIPCPTLIVRGTETDILPLEVAERMVQVMPKARLVHVERAGHMLMEDNPPRFLEVVREFLAQGD